MTTPLAVVDQPAKLYPGLMSVPIAGKLIAGLPKTTVSLARVAAPPAAVEVS